LPQFRKKERHRSEAGVFPEAQKIAAVRFTAPEALGPFRQPLAFILCNRIHDFLTRMKVIKGTCGNFPLDHIQEVSVVLIRSHIACCLTEMLLALIVCQAGIFVLHLSDQFFSVHWQSPFGVNHSMRVCKKIVEQDSFWCKPFFVIYSLFQYPENMKAKDRRLSFQACDPCGFTLLQVILCTARS
jgi:hypothetical protein